MEFTHREWNYMYIYKHMFYLPYIGTIISFLLRKLRNSNTVCFPLLLSFVFSFQLIAEFILFTFFSLKIKDMPSFVPQLPRHLTAH